jgi:hypothetical protein
MSAFWQELIPAIIFPVVFDKMRVHATRAPALDYQPGSVQFKPDYQSSSAADLCHTLSLKMVVVS